VTFFRIGEVISLEFVETWRSSVPFFIVVKKASLNGRFHHITTGFSHMGAMKFFSCGRVRRLTNSAALACVCLSYQPPVYA